MTDDVKTTATTGAAKAAHVTDADFQQHLDKAGDQPVFVDFYAEWCGPCKVAGPIVDKLAGEYAGKVSVVKLDTDESHDTAVKFGVMSIPTTIIFKKGAEVARKVGFPGEPVYRKMLEDALAA